MARSRASAKKAGTAYETELSRYLTAELGVPVKRLPKSGAVDLGDLGGVTHLSRPIAVECKSPGQNSPWTISGWWKETEIEAHNLGAPFGLLFIRRYRKSIGESLVVVDERVVTELGIRERVNTIDQKAIGFKELAEQLREGYMVSCPRRGTDSHWYLIRAIDLLPSLDSSDDGEQVFLSDFDMETLKETGEVILPSLSGGVVVVKHR